MAKNKIADLRDHLFATIEALKDEEKPMDISRAKAISEVAQVIIESAKVEVDLIRAIDAGTGSDFFGNVPAVEKRRELLSEGAGPRPLRQIAGGGQ